MPPPSDNTAAGPPRLTCRCVGVSSTRIADAARAQGLTELEQIQDCTRAGTGCGSCHSEIREILALVAGQPVPEAERRLTLQLCESETQCRVEAALFNGVVPKLGYGTEVDLVSVSGLSVDVHIFSNDSSETRSFIIEKLRKLVCSELEVVFS